MPPSVQTPRDRFRPQTAVLVADSWMNHFIKFGGIGVIVAVCGIFVFIAAQIAPLFRSAQVHPIQEQTIPIPAESGRVLAMAVDEWSEAPTFVTESGKIFTYALNDKRLNGADTAFMNDRKPTAVDYNQERQDLVLGFEDGQAVRVGLEFEPVYDTGHRVVRPSLVPTDFFKLSADPERIVSIGWGEPDEQKRLVVAVTESGGQRHLRALPLSQSRTPLGPGPLKAGDPVDLTTQAPKDLDRVRLNRRGDVILAIGKSGEVRYFFYDGSTIVLRQTFTPFAKENDPRVAGADFLLGDVSIIFTSVSGENRVFSLFRPEGEETRLFGEIKKFPRLEGGRFVGASSVRNKGFLVVSDREASLRYSTTETVRWQQPLPGWSVRQARIGGKYDRIILLDDTNMLHLYSLNDPHPEAGWKAYFGKLWYEGASKPEYSWQSSGSTDEFESKLSLIPLIIGSLKGTFYALLFALPVALLAALYTSQFAHPRIKGLVKPLMEIMASLPSVVLGFLAALWLAPLIESCIPSLLAVFVSLPLITMITGTIWSRLPKRHTASIKPGYEFVLLFPVLVAAGALVWQLGPWVEKLLFIATDPVTGQKVADFRLWWPQATGAPFEQRNSLVVGFVMGFAVIPLIFTITEDALTNVAPTLRSASLALGASRWQTAWRVIVPTASAGILSAVMVGFGRAVGETMIVVMATGNTPIMDFNIFSGMRTLSANVAVELPEAPYLSTLYRTLFLGALALFLMTFVVNTFAELLRERLRNRYRTV